MNEEAKSRALRLLDKRDYSRAELIRKLTEKGVDESDAAEAVDYLVSLGFVDDARYAPLLVRRCAAKGYGRARAKQELQKRGIDRALWDAALTELPEQEETIDRILRSRLTPSTASWPRSCADGRRTRRPSKKRSTRCCAAALAGTR